MNLRYFHYIQVLFLDLRRSLSRRLKQKFHSKIYMWTNTAKDVHVVPTKRLMEVLSMNESYIYKMCIATKESKRSISLS